LADTLISLEFLPKLIATEFNFEDKTCIGKGIKEDEEESIPLKSRFLAAFLRIAFCIVSSSVAEDPSSVAACLVLHLALPRGGGKILSATAAEGPTIPGELRGDVEETPK
jgi:hypothetical protein